MKRAYTKQEIGDLIRETKQELSSFERGIKNAPLETKGELKVWVKKTKTKLRQLEDIFKSGKWKIE